MTVLKRVRKQTYRCPTTGKVFTPTDVRLVGGRLWVGCPICAPGYTDWHAEPVQILYCSACNMPAPAGDFYADRSRSTGRSARCKACHSAHSAAQMRHWRARQEAA